MSLFRKPGDSSSSEDESSNTREETSVDAEDSLLSRINTLDSTSSVPRSLPAGTGLRPPNPPSMPRSNTGSDVRDLFLHSLLEDNALTQAAEHLGKSKTDPEVLALAQQTYQGLVHKFSNQLDASFASPEMASQRAAAKEGINVTTRRQMASLTAAATAPGTASAAGMYQALATRSFGSSSSSSTMLSHEVKKLDNLYRQLPSSVQAHTTVHNKRYTREYEEIEMVGKGGYGKVYKVKNKLDKAFYAVKRIVISQNKLERIRVRGEEELHTILEEVRSLAQFEHPNIVRYHGAWMEFTADVANIPEPSNVPTVRITRSDRLLEHPSEPSFSQSATDQMYNDFDDIGIDDPFERRTLESAGYIQFEDSDPGAGAEESTGHLQTNWKGKGRARSGSQATVATITSTASGLSTVEEAVESVSRTQEPSYEASEESEESDESGVTDSAVPDQLISARIPGPVLTLNIQMSLYESNLAAFLSNEQESPNHCFHACISLELLAKIIKGVEYLHASGVVHRDLKPANVFLSFSSKAVAPAGSIDLHSCGSCSERDGVLHVTPKIGDFGLVTAFSKLDTKPVGTAPYRPNNVGVVDEKLDVFALGVLGFEMLEKFGTKTERSIVLEKVRGGEFSEGAFGGCGEMSGVVKRMVGGMVEQNAEERWTCEEVRREIGKIVSGLRA